MNLLELSPEDSDLGQHYQHLAIHPLEYALANNLGPLEYLIVKYVSRYRQKDGMLDLRKARRSIDLLIAWEERQAKQREEEEGKNEQAKQG